MRDGHGISSDVCLFAVGVIVRIRARRVFVLGTVLASLLLVALPRALALDPDLRISQYAHTAWRVRDGAFAGAPSSITQTTDGYVWIGTFAGIVRFDGVRFVPFAPPAGLHLPNPAVISLLGATDGSLWIGTASGLAQWKNGELFTFPETAGRVNSIYEDSDGTIWIARSRTEAGGVCKVAVSVATCYTPNDGMPPNASVLVRDNLGYFLIGHSTGIVRWKPGSSISYDLSGLKSNRGLAGISDLALAPDGSVWAGLWNPGHGLGLEQLVNGSWKTFITPALDGRRWGVNSLQFDRHNALWIATDANGIYRVHDGKVDHFAAADGLSSDSVEHAFEDSEGNLWLATAGGVDCFRDIPVVSFSVHEGLAAGGSVGSIFAARDGTVWIGNHGQLDFVRGNVVSSIGPKQGLRGDRVTSLFEDHAGQLWVGVDNGLLVYEHGRFIPVHRPDGAPVGIVLAMIEDIDHNVWASVIRNPPGRPTRLICFRGGKFVKEVSDQRLDVVSLAADPQSGLWLGLLQGGLARYRNDQVQVFPLKDANARVSQVLANSDGSVFAATNNGLVEQRGDSQHTLDGNNGLPCNRIFAMVTDKHSDLWLYAECGLIEIKSDDLQRWREHPELKVKFDLFDAFDGAQPYLPPFRPVATRSNDGRLWFANDTVAQMIDPDRELRNPLPPPVHIEDVIADRTTYSPQSRLHLPALTRDLEIDYTALSFVVPQNVHFQYKLEGYDRDWQDAGTRRQAFYSKLPPRNYTFRVKACNNSGVWNEAGASLDFFVAPAYYQTYWFRLSCFAAFVALLWVFHRWRVHQLKSQEKHLREAVETIPAMTFTTLPDGSNTFVNKRWTEYTGLSVERSSGAGWQRAIHPEDLVRHSEKWRISVATGQVFEDEARFRCAADEGYRWFLVRGVPLRDQHGKIVRWYGTLTDIEDRKRAEEALQQSQLYLAEGQRLAHMGSWAFSADGFEYWSSELFRIHGLEPGGKPPTVEEYLALVHPEDRAFMKQGITNMLADHRAFDFTKRIVRRDGEIRSVRCAGVPVMQGGTFHGFLGTGMDVTEQERLTEELRRSESHLAEAQKLTHTGSWAWRVPDLNAVEVSEEWYRIYGFDPAEGSPTWEEFLESVHPEDRLKWTGITERAIVEKTDYDHEFRILLSNGMVKWIHAVGHPVLSNAGDLEGFVGSSTDITELKSAGQEREKLRQLEADLAHTNRVSTLGEMAASLAHEIKQPIAAAITSANSCLEWLAHEPPNLDRARAAAARIDKYGNRAAEIIDRIRSFYKKSPPQRELVDVNGIIHEMLTLLNGEATRYSVAMGTELAAELPKITADRVQLLQVFMNLMLNAIEAMEDSGGELTVKSELQDGLLQFSVSDTGVGLPMEKMDQIFSAFFTTKPQGSGMGLAISRSIVESHGGQLWASANDGRGASFHFTLPTEVT
jgi:PAS domain S-box-containing protein